MVATWLGPKPPDVAKLDPVPVTTSRTLECIILDICGTYNSKPIASKMSLI
jgi:hypothetical protein